MAACISSIGRETAAAAITAAAITLKAMTAPAVSIAPAGPWAHAEEDAVIEIARTVKAHRGTGVGLIVVISVGAGWLDPDIDNDLCLQHRCQCQTREQGRRTEKSFDSMH